MVKNDPAFDCVTDYPDKYTWYSTYAITVPHVPTKEKQKKKKAIS